MVKNDTLYYGGIDRVHGGISIECADKILDILDDYIELIETTDLAKMEGEE